MSLLYRLLKRSRALLLCALVISQYSHASVIMNGNRIIYPASAKEKTLQFTNQDPHPNLVQIWLDINNPRSTPTTADAPFVATPQVFRMEPNFRSGCPINVYGCRIAAGSRIGILF
ncbi:fimbrial biogenesis chaperone [Limnobaculum zhutongyuii]|uniref:fimbrial biogenesis chaperone n=1 Tax=Limnobaculum zhutongyuii TaxID=2498113 RepID=UPI001FE49DEB|nr:fimbria/pilus periplasmic chaperone [Limnobaculum zhutongyuii]